MHSFAATLSLPSFRFLSCLSCPPVAAAPAADAASAATGFQALYRGIAVSLACKQSCILSFAVTRSPDQREGSEGRGLKERSEKGLPCAGEAFDRRRRKGEAKVTRGTPVKGSTRGERHWQQQQQQREVNARLCSWSLVQTRASDHRLTFSFAFRERLLANKRARETRHLRFERLLSFRFTFPRLVRRRSPVPLTSGSGHSLSSCLCLLPRVCTSSLFLSS